jgi:hypothetical protein
MMISDFVAAARFRITEETNGMRLYAALMRRVDVKLRCDPATMVFLYLTPDGDHDLDISYFS